MGQSRDRVPAGENTTGLGSNSGLGTGSSGLGASTTAGMGAGAGASGTGSSGGAGGGGITETIRTSTFRQLDQQKERASSTLGEVAGAVRGMTQPLREHGQEGMAEYINKAADGLERWAADLRHQDVEDALRAVQRFARRQPALFLGIAFTAGVVAARFLKSSSNDGYSGQRYTMPRSGPRPTGSSDFAAAPFGTTSGDVPRVSPDLRSTGEVI